MLWVLIVRLFGGFLPFKRRIESCRSPRLRILYLFVWQEYLGRLGSWIGYNANIREMYFPHGMFGIFISGSATIGKNCVMFQHVTIGSNSIPGSRGAGAPVIGDHCYIGAGAKIIGNVQVGDHCRIGANAVVVVDVPPNSIVVAQPARIITRDYSLDTRFHSRQGSGWCYFAEGVWIQEEDPDTLARLDAAFSDGGASVRPGRRGIAALLGAILVILARGTAAEQFDWCAPVVVRPDQRMEPSSCRLAWPQDAIAEHADFVFMSGEGIGSETLRPPHSMTCWGPATWKQMRQFVDEVNAKRPPTRPPIRWIAFIRTDLVYDTQAALPGFSPSFLVAAKMDQAHVLRFLHDDTSGACPAGGCRWSDAWGGRAPCDGTCIRDYVTGAGGAPDRVVYYINVRDHPTYWPSAAIARLDDPAYREWLVPQIKRAITDGHATYVDLNHKLWQYHPRLRGAGHEVGSAGIPDVAALRREGGWSSTPIGYGYPQYVAGWHDLAGDLVAAGVPFSVILGRGLWDGGAYFDDPMTPDVDESALLRDVAEKRASHVFLEIDGNRGGAERVASRLRAMGRSVTVTDSACGYHAPPAG